MEFIWKDEEGAPPLDPGATILTCFPSAGLATTIAAHYIVRTLKLPRIGVLSSQEMPPIAVIQGGIVNPPIRVYGRKDFAVVLSEFPPTPSQASSLARTLLNEAERRKARWILALEGVSTHPEEEEDEASTKEPEPKVYAIVFPSHGPAFDSIRKSGAEALDEGVLGGVSGALLVQALDRQLPVAVLLATARSAQVFPDHRAGAALIEALDRVLPELKIDTLPLRAQAEEIERALRAVMKASPPPGSSPGTEPAPPSGADSMYQ